jgi:hypothetical protein
VFPLVTSASKKLPVSRIKHLPPWHPLKQPLNPPHPFGTNSAIKSICNVGSEFAGRPATRICEQKISISSPPFRFHAPAALRQMPLALGYMDRRNHAHSFII